MIVVDEDNVAFHVIGVGKVGVEAVVEVRDERCVS